MAHEVSSSLRSPDRPNFVSLFSKIAVILGFVLSFSGSAPAQTLTVTSNGAAVSSGQNLYIDTNPQMPPIDLEVTGGCSGTVEVQLQLEWFAPSGQGTSYQYPTFSFPTGQQVAIDWTQLPDGPTGGQATLTWSVYSGSNTLGSGNFQFNVSGTNPANAEVNFMASSPWFFANLLSWETLTDLPRGVYDQFTSGGGPAQACGALLMCPTVNNNRNGVGIAQLEPTYLCCNHDFWNWTANLGDGLRKLSNTQSGAYNHWQAQLQNWITDGSSPAVPGTYGTYCAFQYPQGGGDYYGDADWIHAYNGSYYTQWIRAANGKPGHWNMDGYNGSGYVQSVCNTAPH